MKLGYNYALIKAVHEANHWNSCVTWFGIINNNFHALMSNAGLWETQCRIMLVVSTWEDL